MFNEYGPEIQSCVTQRFRVATLSRDFRIFFVQHKLCVTHLEAIDHLSVKGSVSSKSPQSLRLIGRRGDKDRYH